MNEIDIKTLQMNPFDKIGRGWMLITAGDADKHNTMTASWGGLGILWGRNAATCYVRHHRYTFGFMEEKDYFSLGFFDEKYRASLNLCGTKSGRDCDKPKEAGLTPVFGELAPYYAESSLVLICKKLYRQDFNEELFTDGGKIMEEIYPQKDLHRIYIGEIVKALGYVR